MSWSDVRLDHMRQASAKPSEPLKAVAAVFGTFLWGFQHGFAHSAQRNVRAIMFMGTVHLLHHKWADYRHASAHHKLLKVLLHHKELDHWSCLLPGGIRMLWQTHCHGMERRILRKFMTGADACRVPFCMPLRPHHID